MAYHFEGKAIFSTRNGEYARRESIPSIRTILRSNPIEDQETMAARLQEDFPDACKAITAPVTDKDVYEYFDYCDAAVQGFEFLRAVLDYIARLNARVNAETSMKVEDYVRRWKNTNTEAFTYIRPYHAVTDLFTEEDIEEHGVDFLMDAMLRIKGLRMQEDDNEARQSALHLQMQHAHMMHNHRSFTQSQAPARPPLAVNLASAQGMRASSNPEHGQPYPQGGLPRHLPGPPGQFPAPQGRFPLQRHTPSTEVLEHILPGSTSRGDFHSDPTAQNAMDTYISGPPNSYVAIPSRGLPGPFTYRPLPPPSQPVPLLNRGGRFDGNLPKGKKNPKKQSSDDARMASGTGDDSRQASSGAASQGAFVPQNLQMAFNSQSPQSVPQVRLPSKAVSYFGNYHPNLPPGHHSGNRQEPSRHPPYLSQTPVQPTMDGRSRERALSNPFLPSPLDLQGSTQDPRPTFPSLPMPTHMQHQISAANEQLSEENAGMVFTPMRTHISQPLDLHAFMHQLPDRQIDARYQLDHVPGSQRPALAQVSNAGQPKPPATPGRLGANETPRRPVQEGCTIWIGGIPTHFDKAALLDLLRPCRGLVDVSEPRVSSPSKIRTNYAYAFADFQNPTDAAEALKRLPQTCFASLPKETFLMTNYPKPRVYPSPGHYQHGSDGASQRPVSNLSPTKSRKSEDSNHTGKSKYEHGRKPSKGLSRWKKQPIGGSEAKSGKSGKPSERVSAVDADKKESGLQSEEATVSPGPNGSVGSTAHVSESGTDGPDSKPVHQDPGVIQPKVGIDAHATKVSSTTGHGAQDASSAPSAKLQVQENHQGTSPRHTEGRLKASKKRSKGSNKLPVPERKGPEPHTVHAASGNGKPKARAKSSVDEPDEVTGGSGHIGARERGAAFEVEDSNMGASTIPLEPTSASPKCPETADQSFLGRNPTEDGEEPKASVAHVSQVSGAKDDGMGLLETAPAPSGTILSAVPLEQPGESTSQAMRRDISSSSQGSVDTAPSILSYPEPLSSSPTERSNSVSQDKLSPIVQAACQSLETTRLPPFPEPGHVTDKLGASIVSSSVSRSGSAANSKRAFEEYGQSQEARRDVETSIQNPEPGETAKEQKPEILPNQPPLAMGQDTKHVEELQNSTKGAIGEGLVEENLQRTRGMPSIQPLPSKSDRVTVRSPAHKRALSIPPRSSSLAAPSTPIKTHQKKKPRNLTPVQEPSPSSVTGRPIDGTKMDPSLQATGSTELNFPVLTADPSVRTLTVDQSRDLPKPETPFLMDDGVMVTPPKINSQIVEISNADRYYAQKNDYQVLHWGSATQINATCSSLDSSDSASTHPPETNTRHRTSAKEHNDLETTLREAGFRSLSSSNPFTVKDPDLALLETIDEPGKPFENLTHKDERVLTWLDEKGMGAAMSLDAWTKQHEMIEVVKKATAVKRLLASSPSSPWTKIESLGQELLRFVIHTQKQKTTRSEVQRKLKAEALLNTVPPRDASISEMQKWSRKARLVMEGNASEPTSADVEFRKSTTTRTTTSNSPNKLSRGTYSRRQQQERRYPVLINQPDTHTLAHKPVRDEDAFRGIITEFNDPVTSGQTTESEPSSSTYGRRTPSEEGSMPSVSPIPSTALEEVSKPEDLSEVREACRRWSDDDHWSSNPRGTKSYAELIPLSRESDVHRVTQVKDGEPEKEITETENEMRQESHVDKPCKSKGKELGSEEGKQDQILTARSAKSTDPTAAEPKGKPPQEPEDPAEQKQTPQLLEVSFSSFESNHTTSNEGISGEVEGPRPEGGHTPLKRSGYNAVAGRGIDGKGDGKKEASKDPWALPQGEKPWGSGCEGRGGKKKREG